MRKYLILIVAAFLLVACGNDEDKGAKEVNDESETTLTAHIDISDEIIRDSYRVMRIIEKAVEADEIPNTGILDIYTNKYLDDEQELTDQEIELVTITGLMIDRIDEYIPVNSERRGFPEDRVKWYETLETGEYQEEVDVEDTEVDEIDGPDEIEDSESNELNEQDLKNELEYGALGEGDSITNFNIEDGEIKVTINIADSDIFDDKSLLAESVYSAAGDVLLEHEGWEVLTIEFIDIGNISLHINEKETNEYDMDYFPLEKIIGQLD